VKSHFEPLPIDAPLVTKPGILDHALANLLATFSGCVPTPVPPGVNPDHEGEIDLATMPTSRVHTWFR
jgi:hypothetical protein